MRNNIALEHLEKLQVQIVECEIIRDLATDPKKREHHRVLAAEIMRAMASQKRK